MPKIKNYIGKSGYVWFYGVVESIQDPLKLGRCRVRIYGWHTEDKTLIPTEDLPWASVVKSSPLVSSTPPTEGSYVQGYFQDGDDAQFPMIVGVIDGIPEETPSRDKGFSDQRTDEILESSPRPPESKTFTDGTGVEITEKPRATRNPEILDEPTTSRLARNEKIEETIIQEKKDEKKTGVATAFGNADWDEPETPYNAINPYNQVIETRSGHIIELDDTPGAERIHIYHRSGSFAEIHPNGDVVEKNAKNRYKITLKDENVSIYGKWNCTVADNANIFVMGDVNLQVDGDVNCNVAGDWEEWIGGNMVATVKGNRTETIEGNKTETIQGTKAESVLLEKTETIGSNKTVNITGTETKSSTGETNTITGNKTENISGDDTITVGGDTSIITTGDVNIDGARIDLN